MTYVNDLHKFLANVNDWVASYIFDNNKTRVDCVNKAVKNDF